MVISVALDDVSTLVSVPAIQPVLPVLISAERIEDRIERLVFDETWNFVGFSLRTTSDIVEIPSLSSRFAKMLAEAMEKNLLVAVN